MGTVIFLLAAFGMVDVTALPPPLPPQAIIMDPPCLDGPCRVFMAQARLEVR